MIDDESIDKRNSTREFLAYDMESKLTQYLPYDYQRSHATCQADLDHIKKMEEEMQKKHQKGQVDIWKDVV